MLVFIDESGDAGLKIDEGSSSHFVVTLVVFEDKAEAFKVDEHFIELRKQLKLHKEFEFHFTKLSDKLRKHFLNEVSQFEFKYFSFIIHKKIFDENLIKHGREFYKFAFKEACLLAKDFLADSTLIIDGQSSREFRQEFEKHLKSNLNTDNHWRIKKMKMQDSHKNNLLQLADMVCGAVASAFRDDKYKSDIYWKIINLREEKVEFFAKKEVKS
jgi:hypothetical protein